MKKRILKRIGCSVIILSSLLMGTACLNPSNAQDVLFYKIMDLGHLGYLTDFYIYDSPVTFDFKNEKYLLEKDSNNILHLKSANGTTDYLSFIPYDKDTFYEGEYDVEYSVNKIYTSNPNLQFLEIISFYSDYDDSGDYEHIKDVGYWLIGKYNNKWVTYVSYDSLKSMGLSDVKYITSTVNRNRNGKMILNIDEYNLDHIQFELYWSTKANRIKMKRL